MCQSNKWEKRILKIQRYINAIVLGHKTGGVFFGAGRFIFTALKKNVLDCVAIGSLLTLLIFRSLFYAKFLIKRGTRAPIPPFLGAFAKLRTATINFIMSVCPQGTTRLPLDGFSWNLIFVDFSKFVQKFQGSTQPEKNNLHFTWRPAYIYDNITLNSS